MKKLKAKSFLSIFIGTIGAITARAEVVVDLEFNITGTNATSNVARSVSVSNSTEISYNWCDTELLFNGIDEWSQDIYGAYTVTGAVAQYTATLQMVDGSSTKDYVAMDGISTESRVDSIGFLFWDKDNFLTNGFYTFDTRSDSFVSMAQGPSYFSPAGHRFVIREENDFYISNLGDNTIYGSTEGLEWSLFDVNDWAMFDATSPSELGLNATNFSSRVFSNVTGVGIISDFYRGNTNSANFRVADFQVGLMDAVGEPPVNIKPRGIVVDLDTSAFANQTPDRTPDIDDTDTTSSEVTYNFNTNNTLFTEPNTGLPIYGAYTLTGPAGSVADPTIQLNSSGFIGLNGNIVNTGSKNAHNSRALLLWDSANFLENYSIFDTSKDSYIELKINKLNNSGGVHAVIRNGETYYISDAQTVAQGGSITFLVYGSETQWAPFAPDSFASFDPSIAGTFGIATNSFETIEFKEVTAVGFIAYAKRNSATLSTVFQVDDFTVQLVGVIPSYETYVNWASLWGSTDLSDPEGNFDGDHYNNLAEYALNGNPTNSADSSNLVKTSIAGPFFYVIYAHHNTNSNLTYRLIDRTDLQLEPTGTNDYLAINLGPVIGDYTIYTNIYKHIINSKFIEIEIEQK